MNPRLNQMSGTMLRALGAPEQDVLLDLWELDFRALGGTRHFFCNQVNEKKQPIVWQNQEYTPYPIALEGFEVSAQGAANRPTLTVSNVLGFVTGAANEFNNLVGVRVVRHQTYAKFLDAVNFINGNPSADGTQEIITRFVIERLVSLNAEVATIELAIAAESDGAVIPSRVMLANTCHWAYRSEECGYRGRAVADRFDMPTNDAKKDMCSGTLLGCQARFGMNAVLPFGGFPSCDKLS